MRNQDGCTTRRLSFKIIILLVIFLIPFVLSGFTISQSINLNDLSWKNYVSSSDNSYIVAGDFRYFDVLLDKEVEKVSIVAYHGKSLPSPEDRSECNYYRWEYDNGVWRDVSGHDSVYIDSSKCVKNSETYSFYIGINRNAHRGNWKVIIHVDDDEKTESSLSIEVVTPFNFFLVSLLGIYEPEFRDKRSIIEIDFSISDKKRLMADSKISIEEKVDEILNKQRTSDNEEKLSIDSTDIFIFNKAPPLKKELERSTVSKYPKSKLKIEQYNSKKSFIFNKKGDGRNVFMSTKSANYKKILVLILSLILISVAFIPTISTQDTISSSAPMITSFSIYPDEINLNDSILLNVTAFDSFGIASVTADIAWLETINLLFIEGNVVNNSIYSGLWQGNWLVYDVNPGTYNIIIKVQNNNNISISQELMFTVLSLPTMNLSNITNIVNQSTEQINTTNLVNQTNEIINNSSTNNSTQDEKLNETAFIKNETEKIIDNNLIEEIATTYVDEIVEPIDSNLKTIYKNKEKSAELKEKRTLYSKTFLNEDGSYQERIGIGPIHYPNNNGELEDINTTIVLSNNPEFYYEVTKGFYEANFKKKTDSGQVVEYQYNNHKIQFELLDLCWSNEDGEKQIISRPKVTEGIVQDNSINYKGIYGSGLDVEFVYHPQYFGKYLIIEDISDLPFQSNLSQNSFLEFNFKMIISDNLDIYIDNKKLEDDIIITNGEVEFRDKNSGDIQFYFKKPYSIDSNGNQHPINLVLRRNGNEIYVSKQIDKNWLETANYPIRADAEDTITLSGDTYDMYDVNGVDVDDSAVVQVGRSTGSGSDFDGYWAFNISDTIIDATINSVTFTAYVTQNDIDVSPIMYGLQQENCPELEGTADPSAFTRTTATYTWSLQAAGTGSISTGDISNIFNEWINDFGHNSPPDHFGLVLDNTNAGNKNEVYFYDHSNGAYSDHTYLTINYNPVVENNPPTLTGESPVNHSTNVDLTPYLYVVCTDDDGDTMNASWWSNSSGAWLKFAQNNSISTGTNITQQNTNFTASSKDYWWNLTLEDGNGSSITEWYHLTTRALYTPDAPSGFTATANGRFQIDLSWFDHGYADSTRVEWSDTDDPTWNVGDHSLLYNGSAGSTSHSSLDPSKTYYYKAWSFNITDDIWSTGSTDNATTSPHNPPDIHDENPVNWSVIQDLSLVWNVTIDDADGDSFDWWINCSNGQSNNALGDNNGSKELSITGLVYSTEYIVWVNVSDSYNQWNRSWYNFTTRAIYTPSAPASFSAVADGRFEIDLSWDADIHNKTLIRYTPGGTPPASVTDGIELYNDTGASTSLTSLLPNSQYSFAAWTWNITDSVYSSSSSTDSATTNDNYPPDHNNPNPANNSINQQTILSWTIDLTDKEGDLFNWTIECSKGQNNSANNENNGTKQLSLSGLDYLTEYIVWVNSTDFYDWNCTWYNFTTEQATNAPTQGGEDPLNQSTGEELTPQLSIIVDDANDDTLTAYWYSNSSGPWILFATNSSIDTSSGSVTISQTNGNFSGNNKTYWWRVNVTDGALWTNATYYFITNIVPTQSGESPINQSSDIDPVPSLYVVCTDFDSDIMTAYWYSNSSGSWSLFATNTSISSGTNITQTNSNLSAYTKTYYWCVNLTDGKNSVNNTYYFTTRDAYTPDAPGDFTATANGRFQIDLSWSDHGYADSTRVEWADMDDPTWNVGDYSLLYNGSAGSTSHSSLDPGKTYYYKAWSFNVTDGVWGPGSTDSNTTDNNNIPTQTGENPTNQSTSISLTPTLNVTVDDADDDTLNAYWYSNSSAAWIQFGYNQSIDTSGGSVNIIQTNSNFSDYFKTYWWSINLTDGYNWTNNTYHFTTTENMNTSVDEIIPYEQIISPHSITVTETDCAPENVTLYYRWSDDNSSWLGGVSDDEKNTVDSNTSDEDGYSDIGIETNFFNAQDTVPDSDYMNIQENNTNITASQWLNCNAYDSTYTGWTVVGDSPYLGLQDQPVNYIYTSSNGADEGWFNFSNTYLTGTLTVNISIYCRNADGAGDDRADVFVDYTGTGSGSDVGDIAQHTDWSYDTISLGTHTVSEVNNLRIYFNYVKSGGADNVFIDHVRLGLTGTPPANYQMDFEYQWTTAEYVKDNKEICIYVATHTGNDYINVNYRNGGSWSSLGTISSTGWNNFTATGLSSSTYTIQLIGSTEISDTTQDNWDIDVISLHTWNSTGGTHGINWQIWSNTTNPDMVSPWSWDFDFPNGFGYYEFYSIGKKTGVIDESAPASADAICYYRIPILIIISYDLRNDTGSKLNNITGSLDVNSEYYFLIEITDESGWDAVDYINITAWYDNGSEITIYNQSDNLGGNLNMFLQYENTTGTANYKMLWPDDEAQIIQSKCSETIINATTRIINITFKPLSQVRWGGGDGAWDITQDTFNDIYSWNFNITVNDSLGKNDSKIDEYGVHKFTSISPAENWIGVIASPGFSDSSNIVTITYSSNYDFNMTIYFEENLTNTSLGKYISIENNVAILANADLNDDISTDITFLGIGENNAVDIFNNSGFFNNNNVSQTVDVQFDVYIPFGTFGGLYISRVAIKIIQD